MVNPCYGLSHGRSPPDLALLGGHSTLLQSSRQQLGAVQGETVQGEDGKEPGEPQWLGWWLMMDDSMVRMADAMIMAGTKG